MPNRLQNATLLKNSKVGVEIEMGRISKKTAGAIVDKYFNGDNVTLVHNGRHHDDWICYDNKGRKWSFMDDGSSSGTRGYISCEMVTPPLEYAEIEDLQKIVRLLRGAGAKSGAGFMAGVHIHVDYAGHTPQSLRNLANMVASHEELIERAIVFTPSRERYCHRTSRTFLESLNRVRPRTMDQFRTLWYTGSNGDWSVPPMDRQRWSSNDHYNGTRYHVLNYHAIWDKKTIEFRCFEFQHDCLHAGALKAWVQLCLAMSSYAKITNHCSTAQPPAGNDKHAMRSWLINMGLTGDEFKTCRKMLTKNLTGDTAYANGRPHATDNLDDIGLNTSIGLAD